MKEIIATKECLREGCDGTVNIYKMQYPSHQAIQDNKQFCGPQCARQYAKSQKWQDPEHRAEVIAKLKKTLAKPKHQKRLAEQNRAASAPWWKDNEATYNSKHRWVQKNFKRTGKCEFCNVHPPKRKNGASGTEWSNISGNYDRNNRKDWQELCSKCHKFFDKAQRIARNALEPS